MITDEHELLSSEKVFAGKVLTLCTDRVRMSDGSVAVREVVSHPGAVGVVALDESHQLVLVNQYRHPVRARLDELPAGLLDVPGESALEAAQRELAEEAGLTAQQWHVLVDLYTSPGMSNEAIRLFLAQGLDSVTDDQRHAAEDEELTLTVRRVPLSEAMRRVTAGHITNAACVAGVLAAVLGESSGWRDLRPADAPWPARPGS
jgi:ADP-ribose pyrophosphatase